MFYNMKNYFAVKNIIHTFAASKQETNLENVFCSSYFYIHNGTSLSQDIGLLIHNRLLLKHSNLSLAGRGKVAFLIFKHFNFS